MDIFLPHVSQSISYMKNTAATHQGTHFYKIYRLLYSILIYFKKREKKSYSKTAKITGEKERKCLMMSRGFSIKELIEGANATGETIHQNRALFYCIQMANFS